MRRLTSAAIFALWGAAVLAAQNPPVPFTSPPGYQVGDEADVTEETVEISTGPLDRETVRGGRWRVFYEAAARTRRRPLDITRHYLAQVEARGGSLGTPTTSEPRRQIWRCHSNARRPFASTSPRPEELPPPA